MSDQDINEEVEIKQEEDEEVEIKDIEQTQEGTISLEDDKYDDGTPIQVISDLMISLDETLKSYEKLKSELDNEVSTETLKELMINLNITLKSFEKVKEYIPVEV